jgi:hypothetical protein
LLRAAILAETGAAERAREQLAAFDSAQALPEEAALAVALAGVSGYVKGRNSLKADMAALRQGYEVAAAQAAGREAERSRMWANAAIQAGRQYDERAKLADSSFDSNLDRLRRAYTSSSNRVQPAAGTAGSCEEAGGPTAGDILKQGERLAEILRDADRAQSALMACIATYPR